MVGQQNKLHPSTTRGWLQLIVTAIIGIGSFLAYSESKYVSKEVYDVEIPTIKQMVRDNGHKLDSIYNELLKQSNGR